MNERLEALITNVKKASTPDLMGSGELGTDRVGELLISLSIFLASVPVADTSIMLALHFGVLGAELDEAQRLGTRAQFPISFEEHLRLFCEYARIAYRDRQAAGFMEDHANVPVPDRQM